MNLLIFDMDGVLVDPTLSYRRALIETVRHFSGKGLRHERIIELKNEGGYNNDDDLALRILRDDHGREVELEEVSEVGERLFWGNNGDGMILDEQWLVNDGVLERLAERFRLAVYTGRERRFAEFTLKRFCSHIRFESIMTSCQVQNQKPAPDGLLKILEAVDKPEALSIGDNIDDARAAKAAGVRFAAVIAEDVPRRDEAVKLFQSEGARIIAENVNQIGSFVLR